MVLTTDQERMLNGLDRTGLIDLNYRWPNNTVPYVLSDIFNQAQKDYIELGLRELERVSCVHFVTRTDEANFVSVEVSNRLFTQRKFYILQKHLKVPITIQQNLNLGPPRHSRQNFTFYLMLE